MGHYIWNMNFFQGLKLRDISSSAFLRTFLTVFLDILALHTTRAKIRNIRCADRSYQTKEINTHEKSRFLCVRPT